MSKIRPLPPVLQKAAIEQLNEVPERIAADIQALKTWIEQQPHLKARTDDQFLLAFLRGSKFSLEKAKGKIDKFYTLKTKYPELFTCNDVDDPKLKEILQLAIGFYLPTPLNETGPRIAFIRNGHFPPDKYNFADIMRLGMLVNDILMMEDDYALVNGLVYVMDMSELKTAHFFQMTPSLMKKMTAFSEEALPLRVKQQHMLNTPSGLEPLFNTFKPMMSAKQQSRMYMHGDNWENLYEYVPKKYLPKEYGGENGSIDEIAKHWEEKILTYREFYKENVNFGTNEKLRVGKPIDFESIFGMDGSFRKLDVD